MKYLFTGIFIIMGMLCSAQRPENIIIITLDGFRWQEVFTGMDSVIADNPKYNQEDSGKLFNKYWNNDFEERRSLLLPFLWKNVSLNGQLYGNRLQGNKVDNANPYWFSYPGYNEIFTGYPDTAVNSNDYPANPNTNVLEFLNKQQGLKGRVAAFTAWNAFDRILNEERAGFPVISAFDTTGGKNPSVREKLINSMNKDAFRPFGEAECLDVFTQFSAMEYLHTKKPKVLYIAYGETDEWAHEGRYFSYLDAAHQADEWIRKIWEFVQSEPFYKNKTALFITTDHGRGDLNKEKWTSHNNKIPDSHEIWFAVMGPGIPAKGEVKETMQLYQQQFAQSIASILRYTFTANHPVAGEIKYIFKTGK